MAFQNTLVNVRESLLFTFLGIPRNNVLNDSPIPNNSTPSGEELAAEIKGAMNAFKAAAMNETGQHVNYTALASSPAYAEYSTQCSPRLQIFDPAVLQTRVEKLAFWINLYNALIIDGVIHFGITDSVAKGLGILKFFRQIAYNVGGQRMSAEDIEHGILRANQGNPYLPGPQFSTTDPRRGWVLDTVDPRIHFALNCASKSCPPIGVYTPERMDAQLDLAAHNFIAYEVKVDRNSSTLFLSQIFNWYKKDFGGKIGVLNFIRKFLPEAEARWIADRHASVSHRYSHYDWGLNN